MTTGYLRIPEVTAAAQGLFNDDIDEVGYVMNATRMWAYQPEVHDGMFDPDGGHG